MYLRMHNIYVSPQKKKNQKENLLKVKGFVKNQSIHVIFIINFLLTLNMPKSQICTK